MESGMGQEYRYDVFLSYRHKPLDSRICKKLHTLLEIYKPARRFRSALTGRVFRDDEELPAAGILSDSIARALVSSKCLVVVCSPHTPESEWVDREVRTFIELGRSDRIFALLISGTPDQSFPPSLKRVRGIEDRTLDVGAGGEKHIARNLKREMLKIIAAVSGVSWDQFRVSDRRRGIRRLILTSAALVSLFFASGLWLLRQWLMAYQYNNHAMREEVLVRTVVQDMINDLQERLMYVPEAAPVVAGILEENLAYLEELASISSGSAGTDNFLGLGYLRAIDAWVDLGDYSRAAKYADKAVGGFERLARDSSGSGAEKDLFMCYSLAGLCMQYSGNYEKAAGYYGKAVSLGRKLSRRYPDADIKIRTAANLIGLGDCYAAMGKFEDALPCYDEGLEMLSGLAPSGDLAESELAETYGNVATTLHGAGFYDQALEYFQQQIAWLESLPETGEASGNAYLSDLAICYANQGLIYLDLGDNRQALDLLEKASSILSSLPPDPDTDYYHATVLSSMGRAWQGMGDYQKARTYLSRAIAMLEQYGEDARDSRVLAVLADSCRYMGHVYKALAQTGPAADWYSKAAALYERLYGEQDDPSILLLTAITLHDLGAVYMGMGEYDAAISRFTRAKEAFVSHFELTGSANSRNDAVLCDINTGLCLYNKGDYESAIPYLSDAAEHYWSGLEDSGRDLKRLYADCCGFMGRCYAFLGEYSKARDWHQESALVFEELSREQRGYLQGYALSLYWAAIDRVLLGESQAKDYYILCLDRYDKYLENGDKSQTPNYLALYAYYYLVFDIDYGKALEISRQAWQANPEDVYVKKAYAYSLLFSGHTGESLAILSELAAGIPTDISFVLLDLEVFKAAGYSVHDLAPISRLFAE